MWLLQQLDIPLGPFVFISFQFLEVTFSVIIYTNVKYLESYKLKSTLTGMFKENKLLTLPFTLFSPSYFR